PLPLATDVAALLLAPPLRRAQGVLDHAVCADLRPAEADMTLNPDLIVANLRVTGALMAALAVLNVFVPRRFGWRDELSRVSLLNRQIFRVHTFFLVVTLALFSALLLTSAEALVEPTRLARAILLGLTLFWGLRMLTQWFYYSP